MTLRSETHKYYDRRGHRLVYMRQRADAAYWDHHWFGKDPEATSAERAGNDFISDTTAAYLPKGSRVLDGGCGMADKIHILQSAGFDALGVDIATATVARAHHEVTDLKLVVADVRALPFEDGCLDGYWSLGVIEHLYNGFEPVVSEMRRLVRAGGFLFVTFPVMSPLRRALAFLRGYSDWTPSIQKDAGDFYQFVLPPGPVERTLSDAGFEVVRRVPRGGMRGLREDVPFLYSLLRHTYHGRHRRNERLKRVLDRLLAPWVGHTLLLVLTKTME